MRCPPLPITGKGLGKGVDIMTKNKFGAALAKSEERIQQANNGTPENMVKNDATQFTDDSPYFTDALRRQMDYELAKINTMAGEMKGARLDLPREAHHIIEELQYRLSVPGRRDLKKEDILKIALMEFIDKYPELTGKKA